MLQIDTLEERITPVASLTFLNLNQTLGNFNPTNMVVLGTNVIFAADNGTSGVELWKNASTDTVTSVSVLLADINPYGSSNPSNLTVVGNYVYFAADDGTNGVELWRTDGTTTTLVSNIDNDFTDSNPSNLTEVNGTLFFTADDGTNGVELWKTTGTTTATTALVLDINAGTYDSLPAHLTNVGGTLYFTADNGANGTELWKSDGSSAGTVLVLDITTGTTDSNPDNLTSVGSTLYFTATDATNGTELWKSTGTAAGTVLVKNIATTTASSNPSYLTNVGGVLFFAATDATNGTELWKSTDGTSANTNIVSNVVSGTGSASPKFLTNIAGTLYYQATDGTNGVELWKSNGAAAGTVMVTNISASGSSYPSYLTNVNGALYFAANDGVNGVELWKVAAGATTATLFKDINPGVDDSSPEYFVNIGDTLYFQANNGANGVEFWKSNSTTPVITGDVNAIGSSSPANIVNVNGVGYFTATDGVNGVELWKTNGTGAPVLVKDINAGAGSSSPTNLVNMGGTLYFLANNVTNGIELWKSNGTAAGTVLVKDITAGATGSTITWMTAVGTKLYFACTDATNGNELWSSDGTSAGTALLKDIRTGVNSSGPSFFYNANNTLYFRANDGVNGIELWKSNGTDAGTTLINIRAGGAGSHGAPTNMFLFGGNLYFTANGGTNFFETYKYWTANGLVELVKDINTVTTNQVLGSVNSTGFVQVGSNLFFGANNTTNGIELWKTNGVNAGTSLVKDIYPGTTASGIGKMVNCNGVAYFIANDGTNGAELWNSDGTPDGTVMVKNIGSGVTGAGITSIVNFNNTLYFTANNGSNGLELWRSNGTETGTVMIDDIYTGSGSSNPGWLTVIGTNLYFQSRSIDYGTELTVLNGDAVITPTITWANPAAITYGTAISATQLNATSGGVPGTFTYSPALNSVPASGSTTITLTFTPYDLVAYNPVVTSRTLTVNKAVLSVRADDKLKDANGNVFSPFTSTISGYVNSDPTSVVTGTVTYSGTAATATAIGNYVITPVITGLSATNYTFTAVSGTLNLNNPAAATPTITWATPTAITYGTALSATQLNATSGGVAGTFSYSPAIGAILAAGTQNLLVTFTPTDGNNFKSTSKNITITVNKSTLTFTATAQAKTYDGAAYSGSYSYTVSGYVNGDNSTAFSGTTTYAGAAITATNAGSYAITPVVSGITSANYNIAAANGTLTINKATLTVSPNPKTKTYTGLVTTDFSSSITGYVNGDTVAVVSGSVAYTGTGTTAINVGTGYVVTPNVSGLTATNYTFVAGAASTLTINKAVLTVTPKTITKTYDGQEPFPQYLALSGTAGHLQLPTPANAPSLNFGTGNVTLEARVMLSSSGQPGYPRFFSNRSGSGANLSFNYDTVNKKIQVAFAGSSSNWAANLLDDAWHHIALVRSSTAITVYVDGTALSPSLTITTTQSMTSTSAWRVGTDSFNTNSAFVKGGMDEVRFWNVARSAADIATYKSTTVATNSTGLIAKYQFSEETGTSASSSASTTGLTGTLTGAGATWAGTPPTSSITGFVNGETSSVVTAGTATYSGTGLTALTAGTYTITPTISGYSATNYSFVTANGTLTINKAVLTVTPNPFVKTYDAISMGTTTSTRAFQKSTATVINGPGGDCGIATDGTNIFISDSQNIKTISYAGSLLATNVVANLGGLQHSIAYAKGYLFSRNGSSLYRVSTTTWASTLVSVDASYPLLNTSGYMYYSLFDTPSGQLGVMGTSPNPVVRFYNVSSDGLTLTFARSVTLNDTWSINERGIASDGDYLYRIAYLSGYKVYSLSTGNVVYDGRSSVTGWDMLSTDSGGTMTNPWMMAHDHVTGRYIVSNYETGKILISSPSFNSTITGYATGDNASVISGSITYTGDATTATNAGTYTLTSVASALTASNYTFVSGTDSTLTINKATLTYTADAKTKVYNSQPFTAFTSTITGYQGSDTVSVVSGAVGYTGAATTATNVGAYASITVVVTNLFASNYSFIAGATATLIINKAALTLTAENKSQTYNGSVFFGYTYAYAGFVNGETVAAITQGTVTYTGTAIAANIAGSYVITPAVSGFSATNYNAPILVDGTLTINKAALTLTADNKAKTYDGSVFSGYTYVYAGFVNNESISDITPGTITFTGTAIPATAAGSYVITPAISGFVANNYNIPNLVDGTLTINKATLTVTPDTKSKRYDGLAFTVFTCTISGYVNSETNSVITGTATYSGAATSATAAGTYASIAAVVSSMSASNYTIVAGSAGTLTINKAALTLTAANKTKTYDGSTFSGYTFSYSGFVNGESVSAITQGNITYTGTATTAMAVGTYVITPNTSGFAASNYSAPTLVSGTLTISKTTLTVIADNKTKNYDGQTFYLFTSTFSGFVNGETASVVTGAAGFGGVGTTAKDVGTYTISPQLNTLNSSNYVFAFLDGTLTINKTTLTVTADNKSKIYDGTIFTNYTSTISGFVNGETASVVTGTTSYSSTGMTTAATGSYTITPVISGLSANNYLFAAANGNLIINKATLTVTADSKTKTYDGQLFTVFTSSFVGFVNNENSSVVEGAPAYTGSTISARAAGSYSITPTLNNLTASNYTFAFQDGTLTINKATLTVTADNATKTYNGQELTVFTATVSGFVNGENDSVVNGLVTYSGSALTGINAGSYVVTPLVAGLSATNYAFSPANGTLIISKATLTVSADNKEKVQDNQIFAGYTSTISGFMGSDTASTVNGTVTRFTGSAITATKAGSYVISPDISGLSALNYDFVSLDGILTINNPLAVAPDITWQAIAAITYGVPLSAIQLNPAASVPGTFTFSPGAGVLLGAGTITITALFTPSDLLFYKSVTVTNTIMVNKATLTVLADNKTTTYSGHAFNAFTSTITGFVNGDNASVISGAPAFSGEATTASGAGTHATALSTGTLVAANYAFSFLPGTLTINKATLTVIADNRSKTYDGVASTGFSSSYTGFVNGENGSVVTGIAGFGGTAIGAVAAGSYTIIATPGTLSAANYDLVFQAGTLTINKALLSVTADNKTKTYDGLTFSAFTSVISGFVGTENLSAVSGSIGYLGAAVSATGAGNYTILPTSGTLSAANYAFSFSSGVLSIGKATLSVLAENKSKTYNGQVFTGFTYTLSGFVNGEGPSLVNGSLAFGGDARAATNAGDYQIIPTAGTLTAVNYAFNFLPGTLTINKAVLTVTADNRSKTYDGQPSAGFTASYTGFANGENASVISGAPGFSGTAIGVVAAGNYPINPTPGNITAPNYDFAFQAGTLVINKALLTVTADNKTKTYDGQVFTAFSSVINGFVNNEDLSAVSGSAGYLGAATSATATGTYPILPTTGSLSAANYAFAFSQGALTIGKATLTVSADNKIKIYDGQVFSAFTYTLTGFANGDGPNLVTGSSSIGGNARSEINAGEYQIVPTVGTLSASNYTFTFAPGILTISKAILFVTAGNFTKTYDGRALNGFTSAITGFVNGENMSVVSGIPGYSGTGATASVAGSHALSPTVGTLAAANYTFALQDGLVTINRAPLMVTADSITKTYDGQVYTSFTTSFNGFVNVENAIVVTGTASFSGSAMTATQVGQYEIAVTLGTLSASNYVLSFTPGTLTINKALLTLTADNKSKTYDGLGFSAFSANVSGFVNGETAAVVLTGNPLFKGPATTATQKGQYLIVPEAGTLHASNYRFATFVTGSLDILRSGPMVTGAQTANFIVNQMLAIPAFRVSDPDSGLLGILDITVTTTRGKITIGSNTAQSITFANTILSANQMLAKIKYTTATDSFLNATISVTAQDRDAAGAVVGSWTMSLAPSAGVFAKIQDPSKPGKTSLVVQGSVKNESIVVKPVSASNLTSYTVSMTGMATQVFTGITGRILAYASGGDDTINVSAVKISTLLSGGEGNDIILGGSAADTIFGNGGNDLLIGGLGADIINGDYGNDILVDGSVTLKSKTDTLDKVLATWNSLPAPTTSIYNNITARLSVVFDKLNKDTMGGGNGIDWFWSTTAGAMADTIGIFTGEKRRTI